MKIIKIFYDKKALLQSILSKSLRVLLVTASGAVITVTFDLTFGTDISSFVGQSGLGSLVLAALTASAFAAIISGLPLLVHAIASSGGETDWAESSNVEPSGTFPAILKGMLAGAACLFSFMLKAAAKSGENSDNNQDSGIAWSEEEKVMSNGSKMDMNGRIDPDPFYKHY